MAELIQNLLLDPMSILFTLSFITILLLFRKRRGGRHRAVRWKTVLVVAWLVTFLVSSAPFVVNPLLATLEDQYPPSKLCGSGSHVVVLGGGIDSRVEFAYEFERMSRSTLTRASAAARIAENEPLLRLIVSGGALKKVSEADVIASYWIAMGIENSRIIREGQSLNTRENAINIAAIIATETIEGPVRLVTSALHMPRAQSVFQKVFDEQGITLCPVSVGRESLDNIPYWAWLPQTTSLVKFDKWLHEVAALAIYRLRGWI